MSNVILNCFFISTILFMIPKNNKVFDNTKLYNMRKIVALNNNDIDFKSVEYSKNNHFNNFTRFKGKIIKKFFLQSYNMYSYSTKNIWY